MLPAAQGSDNRHHIVTRDLARKHAVRLIFTRVGNCLEVHRQFTLLNVGDDRHDLVLQLESRHRAVAQPAQRLDDLSIPPLDELLRDHRPLAGGQEPEMVCDPRFDLVDRRTAWHDPAATDQIAPIGVAEREKSGAARGTVSLWLRLAQLHRRRARIHDTLSFDDQCCDKLIAIVTVCQQRGQRAVGSDSANSDEVAARISQCHRREKIGPELQCLPQRPRFQVDVGWRGADRMLELVKKQMAVGLDLDIVEPLDGDRSVIGGLAKQCEQREEGLVIEAER